MKRRPAPDDPPGDRLNLLLGDITTLEVDAIVNAANRSLLGGGGVDGAIHRAAGPELLDACRAIPEVKPGIRCPTGEARITPGFRLPARHVIHTVGPIWHGGGLREPEHLASCYRNVLALAREHGCRTLAFPAISCGVFGYPVDRASAVAVREIREALIEGAHFDAISLVAFDPETHEALRSAIVGHSPEGGRP
jgi:O-acetyl-ADP-ribose deacetylase (regulator of RNase III)